MENTSGGQRPQLKKLRRPINRTVAQAEDRPVIPTVTKEETDVDSYLDEPSVPAKSIQEDFVRDEV